MAKRTPLSRRDFLGAAGAAALATSGCGGPAVPEPARPNILFVISDDQSYPHASAYGAEFVNTPAFDRVAHAGALFHNAFSPSPGCSPCRAAMLTGRHTWQIENAGTHASSFPAKYLVYPDLLEQGGYFVGYTGKGWGPGNWDETRQRNPAGVVFNERKLERPYSGISTTDYGANFEDFLAARPADQPFCFWVGGHEPHRRFEAGSWEKEGKTLDTAEPPAFLPDRPEIRADMLDYAVEIEHFDSHLGRALDRLAELGELDNTLVIATSDNGMAFPRAKANCYEYGAHMPLAISWPARIPAGREIDDLVGFVDLTATILEAAGVIHPGGESALAGESILGLLSSESAGLVEPERNGVYFARERHSSSRYENWTYPQRALRTQRYLYIRNFKPDRWPAGDPQKYDEPGKLGPPHGGYHDIDACPSLTFLIENRADPEIRPYYLMAVDKRPGEELFDIVADPACLENLAYRSEHAETLAGLRKRLEDYLAETGDPRVTGNGDIWESYKRYSPIRTFPEPPDELPS